MSVPATLSRRRRSLSGALFVAALGLLLTPATTVAAAPPEDISGIYEARDAGGHGAVLELVTAGERIMLYFHAGFAYGATVNACHCLSEGSAMAPSRFKLAAASNDSFDGALKVEADRLVLETHNPGCCGVGFQGAPDFPRAARRPLEACTVKPETAYFLDLAGNATRKYVIAGDHVEATTADPADETVVARFAGKKVTIGRLPAADLDCSSATP